MSKKWFLNSALVLAASLTLVACGAKKEETAATSSKASSSVVASSSAEATSGATNGTLVDGTYTAEGAEADERGWKITHTIVVKDAKVVESKFDYINAEGQLKGESAEYNTNMKDKVGVSHAEAIEKLNAGVVATPGLENIEVVSGATTTSNDFKKSIAELIAAAKEGKTETIIIK